MVKKKNLYCFNCHKDTPHAYVGKETVGDGFFLARAIFAIGTWGASETSLATHHWQCERCGCIRKHH